MTFAAPSDAFTPPYSYLRQLFLHAEPIFTWNTALPPHLVLRLMFTLEYDERAFREMYWNYGTPPNQQKNFCAHFCANLVDGLFRVFLPLGIGLKSFM